MDECPVSIFFRLLLLKLVGRKQKNLHQEKPAVPFFALFSSYHLFLCKGSLLGQSCSDQTQTKSQQSSYLAKLFSVAPLLSMFSLFQPPQLYHSRGSILQYLTFTCTHMLVPICKRNLYSRYQGILTEFFNCVTVLFKLTELLEQNEEQFIG